jgi:hypothetical protein
MRSKCPKLVRIARRNADRQLKQEDAPKDIRRLCVLRIYAALKSRTTDYELARQISVRMTEKLFEEAPP